jgi:hypothetical protein
MNSICFPIPFALLFQLCCDNSDFVDVFFLLTYKSSMMKSGWTCPLVIWQKLCISFSCNSWENVALVCTQQRPMIKFVLSNNLHFIKNACEVVELVMDLMKMNCY